MNEACVNKSTDHGLETWNKPFTWRPGWLGLPTHSRGGRSTRTYGRRQTLICLFWHWMMELTLWGIKVRQNSSYNGEIEVDPDSILYKCSYSPIVITGSDTYNSVYRLLDVMPLRCRYARHLPRPHRHSIPLSRHDHLLILCQCVFWRGFCRSRHFILYVPFCLRLTSLFGKLLCHFQLQINMYAGRK